MKKLRIINIIYTLIIIGISLLNFSRAEAQSKARISNVDFNLEGSNLAITYDIENYKASEAFFIWIRVMDNEGKEIPAKSLTGFVGEGVMGGNGKKIFWDYNADNVKLDGEISVEVFARVSKSGEIPVLSGVKQEPLKASDNNSPVMRKVSPGKAILFSALLPGMGTTYVTHRGAAWLWGVLGYGCIAGSVVLNNTAYNKLEDYRLESDADQSDKLYKDAQGLNAGSLILAGGAAAIWVSNIIVSGVKAGKARRQYRQSRVQMYYRFAPQTHAGMIGIAYHF